MCINVFNITRIVKRPIWIGSGFLTTVHFIILCGGLCGFRARKFIAVQITHQNRSPIIGGFSVTILGNKFIDINQEQPFR